MRKNFTLLKEVIVINIRGSVYTHIHMHTHKHIYIAINY